MEQVQKNAENLEEVTRQEQYPGLDLFKLFFSICVTAIHTEAVGALPESAVFWITQGVFRPAVPFFFVTTGFLIGKNLYGKGQSAGSVIGRYIKKLLLPLFCVGTANGLLELLQQRLRKGTGMRKLALLYLQHLLFYPYGAMWYVQACIVGLLLLWALCFWRKEKADGKVALMPALFFGLLLYGWALLCNNYYFVAQDFGISGCVELYMRIFLSGRNGLFVGLFYLAVGCKTWEWHRKNKACPNLKKKLAFLMLLYLLEIGLLRGKSYLDDRALYLAQILLAPVMVLCLTECRAGEKKHCFVQMRKASIWIYFSHRLIYVAARIFFFVAFGQEFQGFGAFLIVLTVSGGAFGIAQIIRGRGGRKGKCHVSQKK